MDWLSCDPHQKHWVLSHCCLRGEVGKAGDLFQGPLSTNSNAASRGTWTEDFPSPLPRRGHCFLQEATKPYLVVLFRELVLGEQKKKQKKNFKGQARLSWEGYGLSWLIALENSMRMSHLSFVFLTLTCFHQEHSALSDVKIDSWMQTVLACSFQ